MADLKLTQIYDATVLSCGKCDVRETVINHGGYAECGGFAPRSRLTSGLCKLLEQGASGFMRNFGAFFETMMHLRGAFLAQRRTSYDLHLLRGAPIQNVTKF